MSRVGIGCLPVVSNVKSRVRRASLTRVHDPGRGDGVRRAAATGGAPVGRGVMRIMRREQWKLSPEKKAAQSRVAPARPSPRHFGLAAP